MPKITLEVPEELAAQLATVGDRLPELLRLSLQQPALPAHIYRYIASPTTPQFASSELNFKTLCYIRISRVKGRYLPLTRSLLRSEEDGFPFSTVFASNAAARLQRSHTRRKHECKSSSDNS